MTLVYWSAETDKPRLPWFPHYGESKNQPINQWLIWWSAIFSFTYLNWYWTVFCLLQLLKIFFDSSSTNPKTDFQLVFDCNNCFNCFSYASFEFIWFSTNFNWFSTGFRLVLASNHSTEFQLVFNCYNCFNWYSTDTTGFQLQHLLHSYNWIMTGFHLVSNCQQLENSWKTVEKQSKANEYEMNTDEKKQW